MIQDLRKYYSYVINKEKEHLVVGNYEKGALYEALV